MKYVCSLLFGLTLVAFFYGCSENARSTSPEVFTGLAMTIPYRILVEMPVGSETNYTYLNRIITKTFAEVDEIYNKWNPLSELSILNALPAYKHVKISPQLESVLKKIHKVVELTGGMFDPTVETVEKLWRPYLQQGLEPNAEQIALAQKATGWKHIHLTDGFYYKDDPATFITLEGVTRGLTVDLLAENIANEGYANYFIEWGGEVRTKGHHPSGRPWNVTLSQGKESDINKPIAFISLSNQSIATSGDILHTWIVNDIRYNNIYHPIECRPMPVTDYSIASASVVADNCFLADALSKVALTFSNLESAQVWADKISAENQDIAIWLIARSPSFGKQSISLEQGL